MFIKAARQKSNKYFSHSKTEHTSDKITTENRQQDEEGKKIIENLKSLNAT